MWHGAGGLGTLIVVAIQATFVATGAVLQPLAAQAVAFEHANSSTCDLEAEGCISTVGKSFLQDCRTCVAHMELCMVVPKLDEHSQVKMATADDCVVQVADQARGCSACKTIKGKQAFRARVNDQKVTTGDQNPAAADDDAETPETAPSNQKNSTVCDLEATGCISVIGNAAAEDCRTCAAHMELCMVILQLDETFQVKVVTADDCVVQVADQAGGCSACKTPKGKQAFKARVGDVANAASNKKNSAQCDLEATGCIKSGGTENCRTCAAHMELCMHTQSLDENLLVKVVTADDCVEQVADQVEPCSACKTPKGKEAFRTRLGDVATASAGADASAHNAASATHDAVVAGGDADAQAAAERAAAQVANASRAAADGWSKASKKSSDAMTVKVGESDAAAAVANHIPPSPPPNANVCDFDKTGCIALGYTSDCRACSVHIANCMITAHLDSSDNVLLMQVDDCAAEVAIRAEGCEKCGNEDSIMAYKRKAGVMPSPPQTPPPSPPPSPTPLQPPSPPSPPPPPPSPPPPSPPPLPPPKTTATKAAEEYTKLDRYWGALKQQALDKAELALRAQHGREKIEADLKAANDSLKALKAAHAPIETLSPAVDWAEEAETKLHAATIAEEEAQVQAAEAKQSARRAYDARKKGKADAKAAAELESQGITEVEAASKVAKQREDEAHGLKPQVLQYRHRRAL